jgi:hypothetical protein
VRAAASGWLLRSRPEVYVVIGSHAASGKIQMLGSYLTRPAKRCDHLCQNGPYAESIPGADATYLLGMFRHGTDDFGTAINSRQSTLSDFCTNAVSTTYVQVSTRQSVFNGRTRDRIQYPRFTVAGLFS